MGIQLCQSSRFLVNLDVIHLNILLWHVWCSVLSTINIPIGFTRKEMARFQSLWGYVVDFDLGPKINKHKVGLEEHLLCACYAGVGGGRRRTERSSWKASPLFFLFCVLLGEQFNKQNMQANSATDGATYYWGNISKGNKIWLKPAYSLHTECKTEHAVFSRL